MINHVEIAKYIFKTTQDKSILSGFQYAISFSDIEEIFKIRINENIIEKIKAELEKMEGVADITVDNNMFDVVIYTCHAPNYTKDESDY